MPRPKGLGRAGSREIRGEYVSTLYRVLDVLVIGGGFCGIMWYW